MLRFGIAFAVRGARKLAGGLRQGLSEEERYRVAVEVEQASSGSSACAIRECYDLGPRFEP